MFGVKSQSSSKNLSLAIGLLLALICSSSSADRVKILYEDTVAFQARVDMIRQAKSEILIAYFIVRDDTTSVSGFSLLLDAADRGVKVRVMLDGLYQSISTPYIKAMTSHPNIEIRVYNRFSIFHLLRAFKRSHEKIIIADNTTSEGWHYITGGRNVSDKYFGFSAKRNFNDLDVYVHGQSAEIAKSQYFDRLWKNENLKPIALGLYSSKNLDLQTCPRARKEEDYCTRSALRRMSEYAEARNQIDQRLDMMQSGKVPGVEWESDVIWRSLASDVGPVTFLYDAPDREKTGTGIAAQLYEILVSDESIRDLTILSPYVILTHRGFDLLSTLVAKGVNITLITNSLYSTDNLLAQAGYANNKQWLLDQSVAVYHYVGPDTIHAKALILNNGEKVLIGSYNFDPRSQNLNREVGVQFHTAENKDGRVVATLNKMLQYYLSRSNRVGSDGKPIGSHKEHPNAPFSKKLLLNLLQPIVAIPVIKKNL